VADGCQGHDKDDGEWYEGKQIFARPSDTVHLSNGTRSTRAAYKNSQ